MGQFLQRKQSIRTSELICSRSFFKRIILLFNLAIPTLGMYLKELFLGSFFCLQEIHSNFLNLIGGYVYTGLWKRSVFQALGNALAGGSRDPWWPR